MSASKSYLEFVKVLPWEGKTQVWAVLSARHRTELGRIKWYGAWRQYVFEPASLTLFNPACLVEITQVVRGLTAEHRAAHRGQSDG